MSVGRTTLSVTLALALAACGGDGSSSSPPIAVGTPTPTPPPTTSCSTADQIAFADDVLNEWYLFPDLLDNTVNQADFDDVQAFLNARVAPARAANQDVGFTFATSIEEENALISSGSSAGFGIRIAYDTVNNRAFILEAYENGNGFGAGIDRGTELLAIGEPGQALANVSDLLAAGGPGAVIDALGPSTDGLQRTIRFAPVGGAVTEATITKTEFSLSPISERYGALILNDGGKQVAYLNFRTFIIGTSDRDLLEAFTTFRNAGIDEFILDFRYNGGGLVRIAELMGDLMRGPNTGNVFSRTEFRESQSQENVTRFFSDTARFFDPNAGGFTAAEAITSVNPIKIAVIATGSTASASELVTNSMIPYVTQQNIALVGRNTSGKPVGQSAFDLAECDLRVRAVTFGTVNADGEGEYFNGLAETMDNTCRAVDDIFRPLGDPQEDSIATALDFLAGRSCAPITSGGLRTQQSVDTREILQPEQPSFAQFNNPGVF